MAGTVTPRRRQRDGDDGDERDGETGSKRARTESPEQPLLPDGFLRSPNGHDTTVIPGKHQPGSIIRVTLTNFVTYTKAEFHPGPNLNMIIGPNGTGKSTLVCAICLGLAWSPNHLGRAKDIWEFIKHGAKRATIEIELAADPARHQQNPVISTVIVQAQKNPEFWINGTKSTKSRVLELARSFSIQVDNLCQFLPQDRVVEFAALSPVNLLTQTQRAAAPEYMCEWHDELKTLRKQQKTQQDEQQRITEDLKQLEQRHRLQEGDVDRLRERQALTERIAALQKLRPFPEYRVAKQRYQEAKDRRKTAEKQLKRLQRQAEPNLLAETEKQHYLERVEKVQAGRNKILDRSEGNANEQLKKQQVTQEKIDDCAKSLNNETKSIKDAKNEVARYDLMERNLQKSMENVLPEFDPAAFNEQIREKSRQVREIEDQMTDIKEKLESLAQQGSQRQRIRVDLEREKEGLQTQAGQQANKLRQANSQAAQAWQWIQDNRDRFEGVLYGPPLVECSVRDAQHAGAVEAILSQGEMLAFTVTNRNDFQNLTRVLYTDLRLSNISVRTSTQPLENFQSPCSIEKLHDIGLRSWILDLIEGPEPVLAMLCDNRMIHQTGFSDRNFSDNERRVVEQSGVISSWVTPSESCLITRRRDYGPSAVSNRTNPVRPARFFTDAPVDYGHESELDRRINDLTQEIDDLKQQIASSKARNLELNEQRKQLIRDKSQLEDEKATKQRQQAEFAGLPAKLEQARNRKRDANAKIAASSQRRLDIDMQLDKYTLEKGQQAIDHAIAVDALRNLHVQLFEAEILAIEATSDLHQLRVKTVEERRLLEQRTLEVADLADIAQALLTKGRELHDLCQALSTDVDEDPTVNAVYEEMADWAPDQLETEIQSCQAKFDMNDGPTGGQRVLQEYEDRTAKIEWRRGKLAEVEASLQEVETKIVDIREQWEPQLDQLVAQISEAFADNFAKIQCAGEVAVHKDEEFELWAIQIKVKFREHEQLSILDSHRQSGGERAVSTIFYLMALQSLARAPFRVVDEINQGMDPRNERLVHSRMVDIACSENSASQYFLITPKLLNGLKYHPNMKVHCIASGEYMPEDHRTLNFGALAEKALAVRGVGTIAAAG